MHLRDPQSRWTLLPSLPRLSPELLPECGFALQKLLHRRHQDPFWAYLSLQLVILRNRPLLSAPPLSSHQPARWSPRPWGRAHPGPITHQRDQGLGPASLNQVPAHQIPPDPGKENAAHQQSSREASDKTHSRPSVREEVGEFVPVDDTACISRNEGSPGPAPGRSVLCHIHGSARPWLLLGHGT